ncbi:twin-arginine translocation pathway signal [Variovorax paradoxus]|uniref:Bug family tripartite tricarboxylate transporter substrate binding protein n=2 Tax=Comamonadaceae TaxID=80864 RepID=UPI00068F0FF3|nr:tripartite tricarboxylate transporter substrate binding protein [Xenophilus azovorans]KPU94348.1 twin-arginine translocation pathway signal [Variovorax paradoxus]MBN8746478.1 tripartite tricarboxylate transporter substrate binding protein [Variovorax sp.]KPU99395.1 twin-arginine translocation pathway signal [Variovorax paradoxus]KPV08746.1 twin-arginine translocation pathway signal [Variovorax paradoxus]KPV15302.1 twin-arginine translocation pathway signal [Variovorax paradoxus]|tara:strand:- start:81 stop:1079 length:999 start_codon:yes stop_codon:yes gene_type:complete
MALLAAFHTCLVRCALAVLCLGTTGSPLLAAEVYPSKPIKLIVPFPPGGPTDIMGRLVAKIISDKLGQSVVVENKPGAGGNVGTDTAAKSPGDGYTLVLSAVSPLVIAPSLQSKLPYDYARDFTPITLVALTKAAIVAHPSIPFSDLKGMVAYARANPGKLTYGSSGVGTANHLLGEMLQSAAGVQMLHVPYKGTAPLVQDLLGGQLMTSIESSLSSAAPNIRSGKLKGIAVVSSTRSPLLPEVPTVAEQGYTGLALPFWFGLLGPAKLPGEVTATLNKAVTEGLRSTDVVEGLAQIGAEPLLSSPEQFAEYMRTEHRRWAQVIREAKITLD